jgi:anti-anti-sigma factor
MKMALQPRSVIVRQLPQSVNDEQAWAFLEVLKASLPADRPRIVLNCSMLATFDRSSLHLLLCCLEEAMKHNGDVRLSFVSEPALAVLESTGIENLFKIFDSDAEAVKSFQRHSLAAMEQEAPVAVLSSVATLEVEMDAMDMPLQAAENAA